MPPITSASKERNPCYIVLGSGGHTAEMCLIMEALLSSEQGKSLYQPISFLVADTDTTSRDKVKTAVKGIEAVEEHHKFIPVPRSREVGQGWLTTIFTTLWALLWSCWLVWRDKPRLVLCNGPGTCVPFCYAAYMARLFRRLTPNTKIVFVESFCRVQTLSLSGRLLLPIVDLLVVQWPALAERYRHKKNVKYFGRMI